MGRIGRCRGYSDSIIAGRSLVRGLPGDIPLCVGGRCKQAGELLELFEDAAQNAACGETAEQFAASLGLASG